MSFYSVKHKGSDLSRLFRENKRNSEYIAFFLSQNPKIKMIIQSIFAQKKIRKKVLQFCFLFDHQSKSKEAVGGS